MEQDVIGHLIDVERQAYDLLVDAQNEAERRKTAAKEEAEQSFRSEYEKMIQALESELDDSKKLIDASRTSEFSDFASYLDTIPQDRRAFNDYLDSVING